MVEINEGFKLTEVGAIPEDWQLFKVDDLIDLLTDYDANGSFASVAENVKVYDHEEYAWYVRSTDLENNSKISEVRYVDKPSYNYLKKTALFGGELLFLKRGDIGKVYLFEMKTKRATVAPNLYLLKLNSISFGIYLYYFFLSKRGQAQLISKNASSTLGALYKDDVKSVFVPLPPTLNEQRAIATALSDVDDLITSLDKLIEKKKMMKQGAMQELLTGKTRLDGFGEGVGYKQTDLGVIPEDWDVKTLGGVGEVKMCKRIFNHQTSTSGDVPFYKIGTFGKEPDAFIGRELYEDFKRKFSFPKKGQTLISASGTIGRTVVYNGEDAYYQDSNIIWLDNDELMIVNEYLFHVLNVIKYNTEGSTIKRLYNSIIKNSKIALPPTIQEQKAIAETLSEMGADISALQTKRDKYKQIKQGMMQELLTGKTRLV